MRVDLCRRQIGVAEHDLDRAQIGAPLEQVRGERVAQDVRAEVAAQAGRPTVRFEDLPEPDPRQRAAPGVDELLARLASQPALPEPAFKRRPLLDDQR